MSLPWTSPSRLRAIFCAGFALCLAGAAAGQSSVPSEPDPTGEWLVANRVASIRIADCDGKLWGVVASETNPGIDSHNPDPNLRTRPTLGMPILLGMARTKFNQWDGQIYDSEDGHTYSASIKLVNANVLRVGGCFLGFLCGGENWTRVDPQSASPPAAPARNSAAPRNGRSQAGKAQANPAEQVCLSVFGPAWLSHQRGLK